MISLVINDKSYQKNSNSSPYDYANMAHQEREENHAKKVSKMKFEIRGTISEKSLSINVQDKNGGDDGLFPKKDSLANMAKITIKENEWTVVELDVAKAAAPSAQIINAFCIVAAKDWGVPIESNQYFEIRNLDWVDSKGNSVKITLK